MLAGGVQRAPLPGEEQFDSPQQPEARGRGQQQLLRARLLPAGKPIHAGPSPRREGLHEGQSAQRQGHAHAVSWHLSRARTHTQTNNNTHTQNKTKHTRTY